MSVPGLSVPHKNRIYRLTRDEAKRVFTIDKVFWSLKAKRTVAKVGIKPKRKGTWRCEDFKKVFLSDLRYVSTKPLIRFMSELIYN